MMACYIELFVRVEATHLRKITGPSLKIVLCLAYGSSHVELEKFGEHKHGGVSKRYGQVLHSS